MNIDVGEPFIANCFKKAGFGQYFEWQKDDIPLGFLSNIDES